MSDTNKWVVWLFISSSVTLVGCGHDSNKNYCISELKYCNSKYVRNCSVVTYREKINGVERSLTDVNLTTLRTFSNNITLGQTYTTEKGFHYKPEHKFCDLLRHPWVETYLSLYHKGAKIPCPFPPGLLQLKKMEIPLQNSPVPLVPGLYRQIAQLFHTKTKERYMIIHYTFNIAQKKRNAKKRGKV